MRALVSEIAVISGVRDGHRNRKSQKRCDFGALRLHDSLGVHPTYLHELLAEGPSFAS